MQLKFTVGILKVIIGWYWCRRFSAPGNRQPWNWYHIFLYLFAHFILTAISTDSIYCCESASSPSCLLSRSVPFTWVFLSLSLRHRHASTFFPDIRTELVIFVDHFFIAAETLTTFKVILMKSSWVTVSANFSFEFFHPYDCATFPVSPFDCF